MEFDVWTADDLEQGRAMLEARAAAGIPAELVRQYPDATPAGNSPTYSNGFSMGDFTGALRSVSDSVANVAKTVYGLETGARQIGLQRLQTATAVDVMKAQTAAARDIALAESQTAIATAQGKLAAAKQSAVLNSAFGGSSDLLMWALLGAGVWMLAKGAR